MTQGFQNAFISYGRADSKAFAKQLNDRLLAEGLEVWFDFDDIPLGVDYQNQIDDGIEKADNFLFVIAPHSVNSPYCLKEVELALRRNKRIIPLLHVEQISRETWQQRNPTGTDEEWETYQSLGKHSSFPNMHPAISKINWVYCREGIDDFEAALKGLLTICDRHRDYVHQHTILLAKALDWERNQKQSRYLLVGEERERAEAWLKTIFKDEQPPCIPTDLHCEFITESIKYANNLMTQVFLSYATEDIKVMQQVGASLRRAGFTVWTNKTDIQTGTGFQEAIHRGIEETDTIIYLLSPHALHSEYCQQEISYALSLNKRIIPLLVGITEPSDIPKALRGLQYIDVTDNETEADYQQDESQLIKILRQDASYYEDHKLLLTKALKWKRQGHSSLLLRGYRLQRSEAWLKIGKQRQHHRPLPLHEEFITKSLAQPPGSLDVFIAYSLKDASFARKVNDGLESQQKITWFELESIPADADLQQELNRGIENSDTFLLIISPNSISSPTCVEALHYAEKLSKRIVTIVYRSVPADDLLPTLTSAPGVDFNQQSRDFSANFRELIGIINTDREHLKTHTRLLLRALEWEQKDKDENSLLRGNDLSAAEQWLVTSSHKEPEPSELQHAYILASRQQETSRQEAEIQRQRLAIQRQRMWLGAVAAISVIAIIFAVAAVGLYHRAEQERKEAVARGLEASSKRAGNLFSSNDQLTGMQVALQVAKQAQTIPWLSTQIRRDIDTTLRQTIYGITEQNRLLGHRSEVQSVALSPDGKLLATASSDGTAKLWSIEGKRLQIFDANAGKVFDVDFSPDGKKLVTGHNDRIAQVWDLAGKRLVTLKGHNKTVRSVSFSPDGKTIVTGSSDRSAKLWNLQGKMLKTLTGHSDVIYAAQFSKDGQFIATASADKTIKLWDRNGKLLTTLIGHTDEVYSVAFSPKNNQFLASAGSDNTVKIWSLKPSNRTSQLRQINATIPVNFLTNTDVEDVTFSPDGKTIATASADNTINLLTLQGRLISSLKGHTDTVYGVKFSADGKMLVSVSGDRTARLWRLNNPWVTTLVDPTDSIYSLNYSHDGKWLAAGSNDGSVMLWQAQNYRPVKTFHQHKERISWVNFVQNQLLTLGSDGLLVVWKPPFKQPRTYQLSTREVRKADISPDKTTLALANDDGTVQLWDLSGKFLKTLTGHGTGIGAVSFSPNGQLIASGDDNGMMFLWNQDGTLVKQLSAHQDSIRSINFSPDGQLIASASDDQTVQLWKTDGTLIQTLNGHTDSVRDVFFSSDSQFLASGSYDNTAIIWSRTGTLLSVLKGHHGPVIRVRFSRDGKTLATGSADNTVKLWKLGNEVLQESNTNALIQDSCQWLRDFLQNHPSLHEQDRTLCQ